MAGRIASEKFLTKVTDADTAAAMIKNGDKLGTSGFTGAGYPKAVPIALAQRIKAAHERGEEFMVSVFTGASTAPDLDGELSGVDGMYFRTPYQGDPTLRGKINDGTTYYADIHLSHLHNQITAGFFGDIDWAIIEASSITKDGQIVPSSSVGMSRTYLEHAKNIIIEVNEWQSEDLFGLHDVWYGIDPLPPNRKPIPITHPGDIIGQPFLNCDFDKVRAVVMSDMHDRNSPFKPLDDDSRAIAGYLLDFFDQEVKAHRLPPNLLPMQSGVGNVANAVLEGLLEGPYENMTSYTEVIRRIGVIACNGMIEADIYGNVNSTHIGGTRMMNGIGGSGDFTRNAFLSCFVSPSLAKGGAISAIVPMVSHVDHTEHDVDIIITEQGLADLRGLAPRQRVNKIIDNCAHPDYRPLLHEYYEHALKTSKYMQTPHDLKHAFDFHTRLNETGTMMA